MQSCPCLAWWDLAAGLVAVPLVSLLAYLAVRAGYERWVAGGLAAQSGACWGAACWMFALVFAAFIPLAALTPVSGVAIWIWIGASLLLAAARGYGGLRSPRVSQRPHRPPGRGRLPPVLADRQGGSQAENPPGGLAGPAQPLLAPRNLGLPDPRLYRPACMTTQVSSSQTGWCP
jgi:hypothetical protein